ncbi:MAG: HPr Serine kinase C-terminal domain [Actinomycetota bacterium]
MRRRQATRRPAPPAKTAGLSPRKDRRVVEIGDVPVLLETSGDDRSAAVAALLGGIATSETPPAVSIRYEDRGPELPARPPNRTYADMRVWSDDDTLVLQYANGTRARVAGGVAHIGGDTADFALGFARLFHPVIAHLLAAHDRLVLHAAAVERDAAALLVMGATGSGKSTVALAAAESGWTVLGDDLAVLRFAGAELEVAGVGRRLAFPPNLGARAERRGSPIEGDARGRWMLPSERLAVGWFPVVGVVLLKHSSADGSLQRCEAEEVFDIALDAFAPVADARRLRQILPYCAAIARLSGWELGLGVDVATRLDGAARRLVDIAATVAMAR